MNRTRIRIKAGILQAPYMVCDALRNRRWVRAARRFLILRHSGKHPYFHDYFLRWMEAELPEIRALFELRLLPCYVRDWSGYLVCAAWLQDPAEDWLPRRALARVRRIERECRQRGIPVVNRVRNLSRAVKSIAAPLIAVTGVRTPQVQTIRDPQVFQRDPGGMRFPLIIREDRKHAAPTCLVETPSRLRHVPWSRFAHPVAAEFIDVRSPGDGLYRKYRYLAAGDFGVPRHMVVSRNWEVRAAQRLRSRAAREEEVAYLDRPDPNHAVLQRIRKVLELDVVAFDYSYDPEGRLVVWEANPFPNLSYPAGAEMDYTRKYVERSFAAMVAMYLEAGRQALHPRIEQLLAVCGPASGAGVRAAESNGREFRVVPFAA